MLEIDNKQLIFVGGKGGVGKSSSSSAISLHLSEIVKPGEKILLFSTDPAHSIGDSFNIKIQDVPTPITKSLDAVEVNTDQLMDEFKGEHGDAIKSILLKGTHINKQEAENAIGLAIPGIDEFLSLMKLSFFLNDKNKNYKTIVVDTAPTGHTLRLLSMPNVVNGWVMFFSSLHNRYKNIIWRIKGEQTHDNMDDFINILSQGILNVYGLISNSNKTEFIIVTIPDLMAIEETKRLYISLYSMGIYVKNMIINNIQANTDCAFCRARRNHQNKYINEINRLYPGMNKIYIPLFPADINGMDHLRQFKDYLFA